MKKSLFSLSMVLLTIMAIASSPAISKTVKNEKKAALESIVVKPEKPSITAGGSVELVAMGYDKSGKEVAINPTWSLKNTPQNAGTLNSNKGSKVMFSGKVPGKSTIAVHQGKIKSMIEVEIVKGETKAQEKPLEKK